MIRLFDLLWQNKFSFGRHISLFMIQTYVIMLYIVFRAVI